MTKKYKLNERLWAAFIILFIFSQIVCLFIINISENNRLKKILERPIINHTVSSFLEFREVNSKFPKTFDEILPRLQQVGICLPQNGESLYIDNKNEYAECTKHLGLCNTFAKGVPFKMNHSSANLYCVLERLQYGTFAIVENKNEIKVFLFENEYPLPIRSLDLLTKKWFLVDAFS